MAGSCFTKGPPTRTPTGPAGLKIPETAGFVVKSTKTTDDFEARRFTEDLYYRLEGKARRGEPIYSRTFRKVFAEWARVPSPAKWFGRRTATSCELERRLTTGHT